MSKTYDQQQVRALDGIDLSVFPGEFFSLLGPSGSGKSTTLRLIAGFEAPNTGRVHIDGADVTDVRPYHRDVNTVFQSYALFPHMTVAENVAYPLKMKRIDRRETGRRVADALELVDMTDFHRRLPHQLSGGQRQRIALARALVARPKVVLLDEPLGALDLKLRQQMQIVLKELQREVNITFVYVTHDQGEALSMSDRLAVMNAGRIEQLGTPEEIYYRPATRFVAGFIGRSNLIDCPNRERRRPRRRAQWRIPGGAGWRPPIRRCHACDPLRGHRDELIRAALGRREQARRRGGERHLSRRPTRAHPPRRRGQPNGPGTGKAGHEPKAR